MIDPDDQPYLSCDAQVLHGIGPLDWTPPTARPPAVPVHVQRVNDPDGELLEEATGGVPFAVGSVLPLDLLGHMIPMPVLLAAMDVVAEAMTDVAELEATALEATAEEFDEGAEAEEEAEGTEEESTGPVSLPDPPPLPVPPVVGAGSVESDPAVAPFPIPAGAARRGGDTRPRPDTSMVDVARVERDMAGLRQTVADLQRLVRGQASETESLRAGMEDLREDNRKLRVRLKKVEAAESRVRKSAELETVGVDLTDRRLQLIEYHLKRINEVLQLGPLEHKDAVSVRDLVRYLSRLYSDLKTGKPKVPAPATGVMK